MAFKRVIIWRVGPLFWLLGADLFMAHIFGLILIWGSWAYISLAIFQARRTYKMLLRVDPTYQNTNDGGIGRLFHWHQSSSIFKFISDRNLENKGYAPALMKNIDITKFMYATAPVACILFIIGIALR